MRRLMVIVLVTLLTCHASAQFGVIGRSLGLAVPAPTTPCDLVAGCVAAYSAQRKMLASYSGALFQLKRSSDGFASTQDIGLVAGATDYATILTYCGATSSFGPNTSTVNGCKFWKIYDQSGNGNDLTSVDTTYAQCLTPYSVDAASHVIFLNGPAADHCHFGNRTPTNAPTGNSAVSLYVVGDDILWGPLESAPFGYGMDFGMLHNFAAGTCCSNGSDFDIVIRTNGQFAGCGTCQTSDFKSIGVDLETDVVETPYAIADHDATEASLSTNLETLGSVRKFVATATYNVATSDIIFDFQYGLASARTYTINWNATNTTSMTGIALGSGPDGAHLAEIRQGYTGDSTGATPGGFYEGAIWVSTPTQSDMRTLHASAETFYTIAAPTVCTNGGVNLIGGSSVVTGAWGIRQLNPTTPTGTIVIARADNGNLKALGTASGTCSPDVSGVAAFLNGTTGHVYDLPNQVLSLGAQNAGWQSVRTDQTRFTSAGSATTGPTFTLNGLNTTLPVMTCGGSDVLTSLGSTNAITRPWTMAASAKRTSTGGTLFADGAATNLLYNGSANLLGVQSSSGTQTLASTDGTWHAVAGTVPDTTHITAYVNGTGSNSGSVTTGNTASSTWKLCNGWTGALTEVYLLNATDAGATALSNLATVQRSIGGF